MGGFGGAFDEAVEIPAHQLGAVSFRHVAGKGHGVLFIVHADDGAGQRFGRT